MVKVTEQNVRRLSENVLVEASNHAHDTKDSHTETLIENELNRRHAVESVVLSQRQVREQAFLIETHRLETLVQNLFNQCDEGKVKLLVSAFGKDFIEDYIIDRIELNITSLVASKFSCNLNSYWEYETETQLDIHLTKLLYDRIYTKFMRDASEDLIYAMKKALEL